jgi:predicted DNA-binding protein
VPKKSVKKIVAKGAEQYMLRLPAGLRDVVARRAAENGRSMNTEIIEAIEKHLRDADRVTLLWDFFQKHRHNIETLDAIRKATEALERGVNTLTDGSFFGVLERTRESRNKTMPLIPVSEADAIRTFLKETGTDEAKFLVYMGVSRIEEIRDFERAVVGFVAWRRAQQAASTPGPQFFVPKGPGATNR